MTGSLAAPSDNAQDFGGEAYLTIGGTGNAQLDGKRVLARALMDPATGLAAVLNPRLDPTNDQVAIGRWNGTTFDTQTGNQDIIVLASGIHAASYQSADLINYNARGAMFFFNVTVVPGTDTVQLRVDGKDPASAAYTALFLGTATAATGMQKYAIYPGGLSGGGGQLTLAPTGFILPRTFCVKVTHSASSSFTYSIGMSLII